MKFYFMCCTYLCDVFLHHKKTKKRTHSQQLKLRIFPSLHNKLIFATVLPKLTKPGEWAGFIGAPMKKTKGIGNAVLHIFKDKNWFSKISNCVEKKVKS